MSVCPWAGGGELNEEMNKFTPELVEKHSHVVKELMRVCLFSLRNEFLHKITIHNLLHLQPCGEE